MAEGEHKHSRATVPFPGLEHRGTGVARLGRRGGGRSRARGAGGRRYGNPGRSSGGVWTESSGVEGWGEMEPFEFATNRAAQRPPSRVQVEAAHSSRSPTPGSNGRTPKAPPRPQLSHLGDLPPCPFLVPEPNSLFSSPTQIIITFV